jgi:hypothetical protein
MQAVFQKYIERTLGDDLFCVVSNSKCNETPFQAILLVAFDALPELTPSGTDGTLWNDVDFEAAESTVLNSLKALYTEVDGGCNSDFRFFLQIESAIVDFNPGDYFEPRRDDQVTLAQENNNTNSSTEAESPSSSPSMAPTFQAGEVSMLVIVNGTCNDCSTTIIFNEWQRVQPSIAAPLRYLQNSSATIAINPSQCYCPVNAETSTAEITAKDLLNEVDRTLEASFPSFPFEVRFVLQLSYSECVATVSGNDLDVAFCGESIPPVETGMPTLSNSPSSTPTVEVCDIEVGFSTKILVTILPGDEILTKDQIHEIGDAILATFNFVSNLIYGTCDPDYRQIQSHFIYDNYMETDRESSATTQSIIFGFEALCQSCSPNSTLFNPYGLSENILLSNLTTTVNATDIIFFQEIDTFECSNENETEFVDNVLVDFVSNTSIFTDEDIIKIEEAFEIVYNFVALYYCDPYRRYVLKARLQTVFEPRVDGSIPVEIQVTAVCYACNSTVIRLFELPTSIVKNGSDELDDKPGTLERRRYLSLDRESPRRLQKLETCTCPASPIGTAPTEAEFLSSFGATVGILEFSSPLSVASCSYGTGMLKSCCCCCVLLITKI